METTVAQSGFARIGRTLVPRCPATGDAPLAGTSREVAQRAGGTCRLTSQGGPHPVVVIVEHATGTALRAEPPGVGGVPGSAARSRPG